jgi:hypothetical protein
MADEWFYTSGGQRQGPCSLKELQSLIASGRVKTTDQVWCAEMDSWTRVSQVAALATVSRGGSVPPPLVPPADASDQLSNKGINPLVALGASFFCLPVGPALLGQTKKAAMVTLATIIGSCLCIIPGILIQWMAIFDSYAVAQAVADGKPVGQNEYKVELLYKIVKIFDSSASYQG